MMVEPTSLLTLLIVGLIAGWITGNVTRGSGFGLIGDIAIGIIGAFFGTWLLAMFGIFIGGRLIAAIINATIGAIVLLAIIGFHPTDMRKVCTMRPSTHSPLSAPPAPVQPRRLRYTFIIGDIHGKRAEKIEPRIEEAEEDSRRACENCRYPADDRFVRQKRKGWANTALTRSSARSDISKSARRHGTRPY
jgi:uncharacterized membrane protein YeaQ/YmgE (transglycosylase-associated protein family)